MIKIETINILGIAKVLAVKNPENSFKTIFFIKLSFFSSGLLCKLEIQKPSFMKQLSETWFAEGYIDFELKNTPCSLTCRRSTNILQRTSFIRNWPTWSFTITTLLLSKKIRSSYRSISLKNSVVYRCKNCRYYTSR